MSADLTDVMRELEAREPIFHRPEFAVSVADFEAMMAGDYWEFGASGARYSREFILKLLAEKPPVDAGVAGWRMSEFGCRELGGETYLVTYTLDQGERRTRRSTVWRRVGVGWVILFHQGTVVGMG